MFLFWCSRRKFPSIENKSVHDVPTTTTTTKSDMFTSQLNPMFTGPFKTSTEAGMQIDNLYKITATGCNPSRVRSVCS